MAPPPPRAAAQLGNPAGRYLTLWPIAFSDSLAATGAALAPLETCPVVDQALVRQVNTPVTWDELFAIEAAAFPEGARYDSEVLWSDSDPTPLLTGLRPAGAGPVAADDDPGRRDRAADRRSNRTRVRLLAGGAALPGLLQHLGARCRRHGEYDLAARDAAIARAGHARLLHGRDGPSRPRLPARPHRWGRASGSASRPSASGTTPRGSSGGTSDNSGRHHAGRRCPRDDVPDVREHA